MIFIWTTLQRKKKLELESSLNINMSRELLLLQLPSAKNGYYSRNFLAHMCAVATIEIYGWLLSWGCI